MSTHNPRNTAAAVPATTAPATSSPATPSRAEEQTHDRARESAKINQLRAGVLGANDGIVSVAGMVVGVAAATPEFSAIAIAGVAALSAGALSMAMGEYVSVSTQRDTERSMLDRARRRLAEDPEGELDALANALVDTGIPQDLAREAAERMSEHDALDAHARVRLGLEEETFASPMGAALASLVAFTLGGAIPLLAAMFTPAPWTIPAIVIAVIVALALTGAISAKLGQAKALRATIRTILGGSAAMVVTYAIGAFLGVSIL